jgi:hypothetical protein
MVVDMEFFERLDPESGGSTMPSNVQNGPECHREPKLRQST